MPRRSRVNAIGAGDQGGDRVGHAEAAIAVAVPVDANLLT